MLKNITIENFKGFERTEINGLGAVNLVVGANCVGKTSLLEAVHWAMADATDSQQRHRAFRRDQQDVPRYNAACLRLAHMDAVVAIENDAGRRNVVRFQGGGVVGSAEIGVNSLALGADWRDQQSMIERFSLTDHRNRKADLLSLLRQVDPRAKDVSLSHLPFESPTIHVQTEAKNKVQLAHMGNGFQRVFQLFSWIFSSDAKLVLIDELEMAMHHQSLASLWRSIQVDALANDRQYIITTHSLDCLKAGTEVFKSHPQDFKLIRLLKDDSGIRARVVAGDIVDAGIETGRELR